ncbi:MAG: MarC family protein [Parachlamydiaceae bacterium]|nr:MarC family protein [Parachlamydiaceae bacterium]
MGSVLSTAIAFFLIANPIGNSPAIIALIKDFDFARQKKIMLRESVYALLLALFFQYVGEVFLNQLKIENYTLSFAGGILLLLVALDMLFHTRPASEIAVGQKKDPVFVPIATPLISGPGLLSMIMVFSQSEQNNLEISLAILLAWVGITAVLVSAPYLNRVLGNKGLAALEQIMGLLVAMMAIDMIVSGTQLFIKTFR